MTTTTRTRTHRRTGRRWISLAAERIEPYELGRTVTEPASGEAVPADAPPLGLPVLAELPELAGPLVAAAEADRQQVALVLGLTDLLDADADVVAEHTGVGIDAWLATGTGLPKLERRTWLRAARLLTRLPKLRAATEAGRLSGGQLRGLAIVLRGIPDTIADELDGWLADAADQLHRLDADPDALIEQARAARRELTDQIEQAEHHANRTRSLQLQPNLDGTGGTYTGVEDAYGFALLETLTRPRPDQTRLPDDIARADNLQTLLHGLHPGALDTDDQRSTPHVANPARHDDHSDTSDGDGGEGGGPLAIDWARARTDEQQAAQQHAAQLDQLPGLPERIAGYATRGGKRPPSVLVRAELSTLADRDQTPTQLLTTLAGGHLHLSAHATRTLIATHGADLRLIITDHGRVVGIGRRNRHATGPLTDATLAIHDTCTEPAGCTQPALDADTDHATTWHPHPDQPTGGPTDLDELAPLCEHTNRNRPATGWRPVQHDSSGIRTWTHPRTGLTTTTIPTTWRPPTRHPPPTPPPPRARPDHHPEPGPDAGEAQQRAGPDDDLPF